MKKLWNVLAQTLALNFLILAGLVGWLFKSGRVDKEKVAAIREIVFPKPPPPAPATQPSKAEAEPPPLLRLDALLAKHAGKRAGEQVEVIQQTFDAQSAMLDRRRRELEDLQGQVAAEQKKLADASAALEADRKQLADRQQQTEQLAADKGFAKSMELYGQNPQLAKAAFMDLPDETAVRYLEAMPPSTAKRITGQFKTPQERARLNRIMERMRQGPKGSPSPDQPATRPAAVADNDGR
jgi:hypothetical protein